MGCIKILMLTDDEEFGHRFCSRLAELQRGLDVRLVCMGEADGGTESVAGYGCEVDCVVLDGAAHRGCHGAAHRGCHGAAHRGCHGAAHRDCHGAAHRSCHGAAHSETHGTEPSRTYNAGMVMQMKPRLTVTLHRKDTQKWDAYGRDVIAESASRRESRQDGEAVNAGREPHELSLWRYTPLNEVVQIITTKYGELCDDRFLWNEDETVAMYGFYSKFGGCGTTAIALTFARLLALNTGERVLFAAGDEGYKQYFRAENQPMRDGFRLEYCLTENRLKGLAEYVESDSFGIEYIAAGNNLSSLGRYLLSSGEYKNAVFDFGRNMPQECRNIFFIANAKDSRFALFAERSEERQSRRGGLWRRHHEVDKDGDNTRRADGDVGREYTVINQTDDLCRAEDCFSILHDEESFRTEDGVTEIALDRRFSASVRKMLNEVMSDE